MQSSATLTRRGAAEPPASEIVSSELNAMVPRALLCLALVPFSVHASEATLEDHDEEFWFTLYLSVGLFAAAVVLLARAPLCFGLCCCVRLCRRRLGRRRPQPASPRAGPQTPYQKSERRLRVAAHSSQRRRPGFSLSPAQSPALNPTEPVHEASGAKARRAAEDSLERWQLAKVRLESAEGQRNFGDQLGYRKELEAVRAFRRSTQYSVFIGHVRSKANFMREAGDLALRLPPAYTAERAVVAHTSGVLYYVLLSSGKMQSVLCTAVGLALLSTALAPWASFASAHPDDVPDAVHLLFALARSQVGSLIASYSFFPLFLLLGLLSYVTMRWREWLVNCHTVQAQLHNIGLMVGVSITAQPDEQTKELVYDLYRYLNAIHKMVYQSVTPHLECLPSAGFVKLGLLTQGEMALLEPMANKQRDTLITWAGQIVDTLIRNGKIRNEIRVEKPFQKLRGSCARHHDLFVRNMPNSWFAASRLLVDILIILMLLELPLSGLDMSTYNGYDEPPARALAIHCVVTVGSAFIASFAYGAAWSVVELLNNPFAAELDSINIDPLIASTERTLFAQLRAGILNRGKLSRAAREPLAPSVDDDVRPLGANPGTAGSLAEASNSVTCVDVSVSAAAGSPVRNASVGATEEMMEASMSSWRALAKPASSPQSTSLRRPADFAELSKAHEVSTTVKRSHAAV